MSTSVDTVVLAADSLVRTYAVGSLLRRRRVSAVDGVSLSLRRGEVLGVVGESGCGKSTLARMLVGLERPDSGRLSYRRRGRDGRGPRRAPAAARRRPDDLPGPVRVARPPDDRARHRRGTAGRQGIRHPLDARATGSPSCSTWSACRPDMMSRYPHQFSGGQRQRIGIARALALDPSVLICDEPVSALDVSVQAQVINLLAELRRRLDVAIVFIAHDLSVVRHLADRVAVMYLGRIAEIGADRADLRRAGEPVHAGAAVGRAVGRPRRARRAVPPQGAGRRAAVADRPAGRLPVQPDAAGSRRTSAARTPHRCARSATTAGAAPAISPRRRSRRHDSAFLTMGDTFATRASIYLRQCRAATSGGGCG